MEKKDIYNCPKCAGIYLIKNKINGKCYIGQSIKLQKRIKAHFNNYTYERYSHITLYKAFKKYGIENFELIILKVFRDALSGYTKQQLDFWEKYYIKQYDTYNNGYNSTLGGDAGVLGYKHTEETINKLKEISKLRTENEANWIKAKSLKTKEIIIAKTEEELGNELGIARYTISKCITGKQKIASKEWVICKYNDEFPEYTAEDYDSETIKEMLNTQFNTLSNKEEILEYIKANPKCTYGEISQNYRLCKKTFFNYKEELGIKHNQRVDTKVTKEEFLAYSGHTKKEYLEHFNIAEKRYYKYIEKYLNN